MTPAMAHSLRAAKRLQQAIVEVAEARTMSDAKREKTARQVRTALRVVEAFAAGLDPATRRQASSCNTSSDRTNDNGKA